MRRPKVRQESDGTGATTRVAGQSHWLYGTGPERRSHFSRVSGYFLILNKMNRTRSSQIPAWTAAKSRSGTFPRQANHPQAATYMKNTMQFAIRIDLTVRRSRAGSVSRRNMNLNIAEERGGQWRDRFPYSCRQGAEANGYCAGAWCLGLCKSTFT